MTEPQVYIYYLLSNTHNMFGQYAPVTWYLIYDWQKLNRSHKLHTPLSLSPAISQKKWGLSPKVKSCTPQGCPLFLWPTFPIFRRPRAPPCWVIKLLQWQDEKVEPLGARTPPTTWLKETAWWGRPGDLVQNGCCSWMMTTWLKKTVKKGLSLIKKVKFKHIHYMPILSMPGLRKRLVQLLLLISTVGALVVIIS